LVRTLVDTFRDNIRDQEVRIERAAIDYIVELRALCPRVARIVDVLYAVRVVPINGTRIRGQTEQQDSGVSMPTSGAPPERTLLPAQ
jgi:hypothetical protein